ncbi:MAG TPA: hypothetical protein VG248_19255 [Caulobacteraceae bacterium]|jgi:hypothetical protein|nr:hypothetical protein [Caulobacteraceae bacterium]
MATRRRAAPIWARMIARRLGVGILAVAIGVLVAAAIIAAIAAVRLHRQTAALDRDLRAEVAGDVDLAEERAALDRCLTGRIAELSSKMGATGDAWQGDPQPRGSGSAPPNPADPIETVRSPHRFWSRGAWLSSQSGEPYRALPLVRRSGYAGAYQMFAELEALQSTANDLETDVAPLSHDMALTPALKAEFVERLSRLAWDYRLISLDAHQAIRAAHALGVEPDRAEVSRMVVAQRRRLGDCVEDVASGPAD